MLKAYFRVTLKGGGPLDSDYKCRRRDCRRLAPVSSDNDLAQRFAESIVAAVLAGNDSTAITVTTDSINGQKHAYRVVQYDEAAAVIVAKYAGAERVPDRISPLDIPPLELGDSQ